MNTPVRSGSFGLASGSADKRPPVSFGWVAVLLVALVAAAYQPVWNAGFVWDDDAHLTRYGLRSLHGLIQIWTDLDATQQYYPLTHSALWLQHWLWGDDPLGYHLVNVGLHAANAVLVLLLLRRLRVPGAEFAALVFALHPVMVESVAWITELKNTLSGLCYLSAALVYLRFDRARQARWYALALGLFLLGLGSKTVIASLPGALLVVFWWQRGRLGWRRDVLPLVPFFVLGTAAGLFTVWVERHFIGAEGSDFEFTLIERMLIAGRVVWFYSGKLFWPAELSFIYPRWEVSETVWWQYAFPLGAALALWVAWRYRHRARGPLAALLFFGGTLVPALGFFNVYPFRFSFVADHFQYLASLGIITLAAAGGAVLARRMDRRWTTAAAALLLAGLATLTWRQARLYHDSETLWRDTLAKNPSCWMAHNNLGKQLGQEGRPEEAKDHLARALRLRPDSADTHCNLGILEILEGSLAKAIPHFERALEFKPDYAPGHNNLGLALGKMGRTEEATAHLKEAIRISPEFVKSYFNLGVLLIEEGRYADGVGYLEQAVRIRPDYTRAHFQLGQVLFVLGRLAEADGHLAQALRLQPDEARIMNTLARLRATAPDPGLRDADSAVRLAERAVELTGRRKAAVLDTLASTYAEAGRWPDAIATAEEALALARAAGQGPLAAEITTRLSLYRAGQPWRNPPPDRPPPDTQIDRQGKQSQSER